MADWRVTVPPGGPLVLGVGANTGAGGGGINVSTCLGATTAEECMCKNMYKSKQKLLGINCFGLQCLHISVDYLTGNHSASMLSCSDWS